MFSSVHLLLLALAASTGLAAYSSDQCVCSDLKPCLDKVKATVPKCTDYCSPQLSQIGVNITEAKKCTDYYSPEFDATVKCIKEEFADSCAKSSSEAKHDIQKRDPNTLKLAVLSELNNWMTYNAPQMKSTVVQSLQFIICTKKCVDIRTSKCSDGFNCVLDLPSDQEVIKAAKTCISNNWTTAKAQDLCQCFSQAGFQSLAPVCPKIQIEPARTRHIPRNVTEMY
ncbi:unnamed protein product [Bursaphelenchus okinawaensis]|uniref:Uncharacterized protein n=1 Tax=Bursaphelenchus okinawaensis TaxID=465554 RepID=A0A811KCW1_9BILA|nr:unnamed protein product [Bursaphelenchus okinawaensis]CAG9101222.1 unnamed protein product [Bursaphelenchus okinawaensis]